MGNKKSSTTNGVNELENPTMIKNILTLRYDPTMKTSFAKKPWNDFTEKQITPSLDFIESTIKNTIKMKFANSKEKRVSVALSGGVDSTLVIALLRESLPDIEIEAISVRFADSIDESAIATKIAEKFEAMITLGELNSRMKDFYDIWLLSRQFDFEGALPSEAIRRTFANRDILLPDAIVAFTAAFTSGKQVMWTAFRKRLNQDSVPVSFAEVVAGVETFISPLASALVAGKTIPSRWNAPGPWHGGYAGQRS